MSRYALGLFLFVRVGGREVGRVVQQVGEVAQVGASPWTVAAQCPE